MVLASTPVHGANCTSIAPNAVGWWPGDGTGNDIVGTNNALLQGGASAGAPGMVGSAFNFDGTNAFLQIADAPELKPTNLTIEAWVNFSALNSALSGNAPPGDQYIVFKQNSQTFYFEGYSLEKFRVGTNDIFLFTVANANSVEAFLPSVTTISTGVWYHVAAVRGSNYMQMYVNGRFENQTNVSFAQNYGSLPLYFGSSGQSYWDGKFKGRLDEVSIYNRALSSDEIAAIYAAGAAGKCKYVNLTAQPQSQTVIAGSNVLLTVSATGVPPLSYQWEFNGQNVGGATGTSLALTNVQPANGGNYTAVASNLLAVVTSSVAVLTVLVPPTITTQPQSQTNLAGTSASFTGSASGTQPLSYQWQVNGGSIAGASGTNLSLNNVQPADAGNYTLVVANVAGVATSAVATLTVWVPPVITAQPQSLTNIAGTTASFIASASGTAPLSFQWQHNGVTVAAGTSSILTLNNVMAGDAGNYAAIVTNQAGSATSAVAVLTVLLPPTITSQPQSVTNIMGTTATFSAGASGTQPLSYQWQLNGVAIGGAIGPNLTLSNVQPKDAGNYTVVVSNVAGAATSAVATLTVWVPPMIMEQPQSRTNIAGTTASFSALASGTEPLSYQWQVNGGNIVGATGTSLVLNNVQASDAGNYSLIASNAAGSVSSLAATLTVWVPPAISAQPQSLTNIAGTAAAFSASVSGTEPLSYQWQFNGSNILGATGITLTLGNVQPTDAGNYTLIATNIAGAVSSAVAALTVWVPPTITSQPQSQTNLLNTTATFSASGSGTAPLSYQWQFNGASISGASSNYLVLNSVQPTAAGNYTVTVTNVAGAVTSALAALTVWVPPTITAQPQSQTNIAGTTATFTAVVGGTAPLSYQWQFGGTNLSGATTPTLVLSDVQPPQAGSYTVVVTNIAGSTNSVAALLTVWVPPSFTTQPQSCTNPANTLATFSAAATGTAPLNYQWQFNSTNLTEGGQFIGVTTSNLAISSVEPTNAGGYSVLVTNSAGSITSRVATLTVGPPLCVPASSGLVGWWPGDGNANDISGTNNGTLQGGAFANAVGLVGPAFGFDGTNAYVQIPNAPELKPKNLTIEAWVQFSGLDSQGSGGSPPGDQYIVFKQNSRSGDFEGFDLSKTRIAGSDVFRFLVTSSNGVVAEVDSVSTITTGVWYHVVGVRGLNFSQIYVNGLLERQTNVVFPQDYGNLPLFFGTSGQSVWDHKLKGTLDEVTLYNRALSAGEISAVFLAGASGKCKNVNLTTQPQSQTVVAGSNVLFAVSASGLAPLSYQWQFNGGNLGGATGTNLLLNSAQPVNEGNYAVIVTNKLSSATSAVASLVVLVPPTITAQPQSLTNVEGTTASFTASVAGTAPFSYQWQFNGASISGETGAALTLNGVQPADAGNYTIVVTNTAGSATSAAATLTVLVPPSITLQPQSLTNISGTAASFSVGASGSSPLIYQWQFGGFNIPGANGTTLNLNNVQPGDAGNYTVAVTNAAGASTSAVASLTVWVPPVITVQPQSRTNITGTTATFNANASGTAPLNYQWQFNGGNISGATGTSFTRSNVQASDAGNYSVIASNAAGSASSALAALTVWVPPVMTTQPQSQTNIAGTIASFSASAGGTQPLSYQWQFNGASIAGATATNLTLNNVQPAQQGNYTLAATNGAGAITSAVAVLTVWVPPTIVTQPQSLTNIAGTTASFSASAGGTQPLSYQWQFNGASIAGATATNLTLNNVQPADAGNYTLAASNVAGASTSAVAVLTVWVPPTIVTQPQSQTNIAGTTASFSALASGTVPLNYQWQFNGASIAGTTATNLTLTNVQPADAGNYTLTATNGAGAITSAVASLTVWVPPTIVTQPQSRANIVGTTASFSASVSGTQPLSYQWQFNGASIAGATSTNLVLNNVQPANAGNYAIVVTNVAGASTSAPASLTILPSILPVVLAQPSSQSAVAGTNVSFTVSAAGAPPLSFQWMFNGTNLVGGGVFSGVTSSNLLISYVLPGNAGMYSVVVTNAEGAVTSSAAGLVVTLPDCIPPPAGLTAWWPAEGSARDIASTNHGVLQGGASASAVGFVGTGFNFDGTNGYVQIPDAPALKPANFSIEAWVKFSALDSFRSGSAPAGLQYLVFKQNTRSNNFEGFSLAKMRTGGGDVFSFVVSSAAGQPASVQSLSLVNNGVWYHVAGVRSSNFLQLYVNGQLEAQTNVNFAQDYGSLPLYFGTSGQSYNDGRFAGFLDEVTLYNRALSASEIVAVYRAADVGLCKAPVFVTQPIGGTGYWGGSFALSAAAAGAMPLGYQWAKASTLLANATNSSLFLNRLQLANAGNYAVTASNLYGMATSAAATLNLKVADVALGFSGGGGGPGTPGLTVNGVPGQIYGIQYSANLGASTTWLGLTNVTLSGPTLTWYDPQAATVPQRYYRVVPGPIPVGYATWEVLDIGALWSDDFNRASLGSNWVILGGANAVVTNNELSISQTNVNLSRQLYYQPWLLSSDEWTIRWSQQFGALNAGRGVGVGIKNFEAAGGDDRGYNGLLSGSGADLGQMEIQRFDGIQQGLVASGPAMSLAAGDFIDCSLTRSGWTITATASNRVNGQVSSTSLVFSDAANLIAPTISRACIYPIQGAVYLDDISFTINHRKPARYVVVGASLSEGYNASSYSNGFLQVAQRSLSQTICNDSSSFNTTTNAVSILPEILAHQPSTAILELGGNDLQFGYPATQWQSQYSNLVVQLQLAGIQVKHCLSPPRNVVDLTPLKNWISTNYPAKDVIDLWTPLLQGSHSLNPAYDSGDGVHPNDAGHLLLGTVISTSLP